VNDGAAVCRHCGFAFDPALISTEQPARRKRSGFTKQHSVVAPPASSEGESFEAPRTDESAPAPHTAPTGEVDGDDAEPDVDVFATQPAGPPAAALDEFRDLSHDVTERGPARDLVSVAPPEADVAATVVQDMASALAAYGLRDAPSSPPDEGERTVISPPPTHPSSSSSEPPRRR
jgi:hypothetical protein